MILPYFHIKFDGIPFNINCLGNVQNNEVELSWFEVPADFKVMPDEQEMTVYVCTFI